MNTQEFLKPFPGEDIKQRPGQGNRTFNYVPIGDVIRRVIDATGGEYQWEVVKVDIQSDVSGKIFWLVHGRLIVEGRHYDGIGTNQALDLESAKGAESDAFKRAAVKLGVALHLYTDPHEAPSGTQQPYNPPQKATNGNTVWQGPGQCQYCHAPEGKPHSAKCDTRGGRVGA